jgi:hypothetical protein
VVTAFDPIGTHPLLVLIFFLAIALTQGLAYYSHRSKRAESSKLKAESEGELKAQSSKRWQNRSLSVWSPSATLSIAWPGKSGFSRRMGSRGGHGEDAAIAAEIIRHPGKKFH